jgi:hypothetical protein
MTLEDIIKLALRRIGAMRAGASLTSQQSTDGLAVLQALLLDLPGPPFTDVDTDEDYTAEENERVRITSGTPTITRPTTVEDDGAENGERAPRNGSRIEVITAAGVRTCYRYSAAKGQWVTLTGLTTASENPLGEHDNGLAAYLAAHLAPEYGVEVPAMVVAEARRFLSLVSKRPNDQREPVAATYY